MYRCVWAGMAAAVLVAATAADEKHTGQAPAKHAGFDKLKKLVGEWVAVGDDGKPTDTVVSVFKVTAAGSAVQETLFPGQSHEMVSLYHLNGNELLMTHYCAIGNQPRMKLDPKGKDNELKFVFDGGTNFDPKKDMHMHEGTITIIDDNHIHWAWQGYVEGKPVADHRISLKLVRKKQ